ncbi:MAG: hypothetical protein ABL964_09090 [Steroidobacteraceae bacterium]
MTALSGLETSGRRRTALRSLAFLLACVGAASAARAQEPSTQEFWKLAGLMEVAVPFTEDKVEAVLGTGVSKTELGKPPVVVYQTSGFWLKDRSRIEEATWMPKNATSASALTVVRPLKGSRLDVCVTRSEVSRQYGAPTRSWKSNEGDATNTNFEFERPKTKISVAFSDATNCLRSLTVAELK